MKTKTISNKTREKILTNACASVQKRGGNVVDGRFGIDANKRRFRYKNDSITMPKRSVCAIGALCVGKVRRKDEDYYKYSSRVLGVDNNWIDSLISGFDGGGYYPHLNREAFDIGVRLRQRFIIKNGG